MVYTNNKNHFINSLHRVSKMLKPLLRRLSKRSSKQQGAAPCTADHIAENAANEALEARLQTTTLPTVTVLVAEPHHWCLGAPDRDLSPSPSRMGAQTPEQQCPSPNGGVQREEQEWW